MKIKVALSLLMLVVAVAVVSAGPKEEKTSKIAWYSTLESGLAEAKRSHRPILFISAAPQCLGVPGIW